MYISNLFTYSDRLYSYEADNLNKKYNEAVFCNISTREYVERNDGKDYSSQDFTSNPHEYKSKIKNYIYNLYIIIN